jgi:hypothetical protein
VDVHFPDAELVVLVEDPLNTHSPAALSEGLAPAESKRVPDRLEFCWPPKHGGCLSKAEIEASVLKRQYLNRRIRDRITLARENGAWATKRNGKDDTVNERFMTEDARIKLKRLYPSVYT